MKRILCLSLLLSFNNAFSQTTTTVQSLRYVGSELQYIYTGAYASAKDHSSNSAIPTDTKITVSGLPTGYFLKEIIINLGTGTDDYTGSLSNNTGRLDVKLKDPSNNITSLFNNIAHSQSGLKNLDVAFRNNTTLITLSNTYNNKSIEADEKLYGLFKSNANWSTSANNGDWFVLSSLASNSSYNRKIKGATLIFGNSDLTQTITAGKNCGNAVEIFNNILYKSTNSGCDFNQGQYPNLNGTTNWNGDKNSTAWFSFIATSPNAKIRVNSIEPNATSKMMQSIVAYTSTGNCSSTSSDYTLKGSRTHGGGSSVMTRFNFEYIFTDLVIGKKYFLLVDGNGSSSVGDISSFTVLLEMTRVTALPIELTKFSVEEKNNLASLNWSTASERNNDYFTVSRSSDLENWEEVGTVKGSGSINYKQDYNFTDITPLNGVSYYRLKQTDFNGENESFDPVSVEINANSLENALIVYPNPSKAGFDLQVYSKSMNAAAVSIHNAAGKNVSYQSVQLDKGKNIISMKNEKLDQGVYVVKIVFEDGNSCNTKLVIE